MAGKLYVSALEPRSGAGLVVLGIMDLLVRHVGRVGFFRPLTHASEGVDEHVELIATQFDLQIPHDDMQGLRAEEVERLAAAGRYGEVIERVLERFHEVERRCDFVVCLGSALRGAAKSMEFDFNAKVANDLGCPVLPVVNAADKQAEEILSVIRIAHETFEEEGCALLATIVNRVSADRLEEVRQAIETRVGDEPVFVLPEDEHLARATLEDVARALDATCLAGDDGWQAREFPRCRVAAMLVPHAMERLQDGDLLIVPGDRDDVVLGAVLAAMSSPGPKLSGLILNGGLPLSDFTRSMVDGLDRPPLPILAVDTDTYDTAQAVHGIQPRIRAGDQRRIARALQLFESRVDAESLLQRIEVTRTRGQTPVAFQFELLQRAKEHRRHIVLAEGVDDRILRATEILRLREVVDITLLGDPEQVRSAARSLGVQLGDVEILDPATSDRRERYAVRYRELRAHKGVTQENAFDVMSDVSYFGTMMVHEGDADGMVSGAMHTTAHTIRPAFEFIRTRADHSIVSSVFFMCLSDRVVVFGDCAVNPNPNPRAARRDRAGIRRDGHDVRHRADRRDAVVLDRRVGDRRGRRCRPRGDAYREAEATGLPLEGPMQFDAAFDPSVARKKAPDSDVAGRATVFIFPDLNTGNNTYKAVQRTSGAVAIGPVLQGLKKPVNDLSRGCTVTDIVNTVAITAIQAWSTRTDSEEPPPSCTSSC